MLPLAVMLAVAAIGGLIAWAAVTGSDGPGGGVIVALPPAPKAEAAAEAEPAVAVPHAAPAPEQVLPPPEPVAAPAVPPPPAEAPVQHDGQGVAPAPEAVPAPAPQPASTEPAPAPVAPSTDAGDAPVSAPAASPGGIALAPAPDPALVENGRDGLLPVVGPDGRQPWQVYARPFGDKTARPRIAIIVAGLGLKESTSAEAIDKLPPDVTLAFTPYARNLDEWSARARAGGHELLIQVPMEPVDFPTSDPGPKALMTNLSAADNRSRLEWTLARTTGYVGVMTYMGSRYTADAGAVQATATLLKARGLMIVDSRTAEQSAIPAVAGHMGLPRAVATRFIDATPTRAAVDARLAELERFARQNGAAIGIASDYPGSIERIASWAAGLEARGLVLAPASALADTIATE
ncbi:divergent polysaccharide deacetylase family protein [Zavarzinia aquatilis]|uniref:Divergent polysaccharide deacetylase family protein n=1 Tax=Zavarzinia aquatilis TaxID=2211142 RepID=A0A317EG43_9PROT|nr:divergent polysaccharide deacetylase family protein [Zavarzinia aquatilis]PWR24165.1 divergent polysaccharide deacetylase family protein [Zavarzinia aquatilis]